MTITIEYKGESYKLGFTRESIKRMESNGFDFSKAEERQISSLFDLVEGAFHTYNPNIAADKIYQIWGDMPDKDALYDALMQLFQEPLKVLNEPAKKQGNVSWTMNK